MAALAKEIALTIGGMGCTTAGMVIAVDTGARWPLLMVCFGIWVLILSVEAYDDSI